MNMSRHIFVLENSFDLNGNSRNDYSHCVINSKSTEKSGCFRYNWRNPTGSPSTLANQTAFYRALITVVLAATCACVRIHTSFVRRVRSHSTLLCSRDSMPCSLAEYLVAFAPCSGEFFCMARSQIKPVGT